MTSRVAWLVLVVRTGECIDGCRTEAQAIESAREFTAGCEPATWLRVEYEWSPAKRRKS